MRFSGIDFPTMFPVGRLPSPSSHFSQCADGQTAAPTMNVNLASSSSALYQALVSVNRRALGRHQDSLHSQHSPSMTLACCSSRGVVIWEAASYLLVLLSTRGRRDEGLAKVGLVSRTSLCKPTRYEQPLTRCTKAKPVHRKDDRWASGGQQI